MRQCTLWLIALLASYAPADETDRVPPGGEWKLSIEKLPQVLKAISVESDWGLNETCEIQCQLRNESGVVWTSISAKGDCTCSRAEIAQIPDSGVQDGATAVATVVYTKPKEPSIKPTRILFTINDTPVVLPVLVEWTSPASLQKFEQLKPDTWRVTGTAASNWEIKSITCLNDDIKIESVTTEEQSFSVDLVSDVSRSRSCWLQIELTSLNGKSIKHLLSLKLDSTAPRTIPSRLICRLGDESILHGDARLFFPRTRLAPRPNLSRSYLVCSNGAEVPLVVNAKSLSKAALKVDFTSKTIVTRDVLSAEARIRFEFDDQTKIDCPFLVSSD